MGHIYLSYSHQDRGAAQRLAESLRANGYEVWFDADADVAGSNLRGKSADAINRADACVFLISPASAKSRWSTEELSLALDAERPIVPVILEPTTLPDTLVNRQFVDASKNWDQAVEKIILALEANIGLAQARQRQPAPMPAAPVAAPSVSSRRGRSLFLWVAVLLVGVVICLASVFLLSSGNAPSAQPTSAVLGQQPTVITSTPMRIAQIVIAAQNLPRGFRITRESIALREWPAEMAPDRSITDVNDVIGKVLLTDVFVEQPILSSMLTDAASTQFPPATIGPTNSALATNQSILAGTQTANAPEINSLLTLTAQTSAAMLTPGPTLTNVGGGLPGPGLDDVGDIVAATVVAIRATDDSSLSPQEAAILLNTTSNSTTAIWVTGILAALALGASVGAVVMVLTGRGGRRRTGHPSAHHSQPTQADSASAGLAPLEEYQIFISSSEKDKDWVASLVEDLGAMNYLVWWYVKDAPGLPFGNEIRGAIFHAKVLVIIVSTVSMKSKHIEEEIRWAEIYDRPIIPVLYEPVDVQERLYGLAKGADIDFTDDRNYKESIELLTQAIDHYLKQRLQVVQGGAETSKN